MSYCHFALLFAFAAGMSATHALDWLALGHRYRASGNAIAATVWLGLAIWLVR